MTIVNTTPHDIRFQAADGSLYTVEPCGLKISAQPETVPAFTRNGTEFIRTNFVGTDEGMSQIKQLEEDNPDCVIVGSIIAAQAYPSRVFGLVAVPGYERVPPSEKRYLANKFVTF